ncbi:MAG: type II toxin-antitoxin system HicA family toxin [Anaerolineae bacterium]
MGKLPVVTSRELIRVLEGLGFEAVRQKGSHLRLRHPDGRVVTVPIHPGQDIGRGLLRKILRDVELSPDELAALLER